MLAIALHMTTNEGTFAKVSRILRDAELPEGRHHSDGGKALCALAGVDGYIVNIVRKYERGGWTPCVVVDYRGKDRDAALTRCAEVLRKAGLAVDVRSVSEFVAKRIVWVLAPL